MKALTVRQPWAWAIIHAGKDVEDPTWSTDHRGPLVIHAGQRWDSAGEPFLDSLGIALPDALEFGAVVGRVEVIGCVEDSQSAWALARHYHWELSTPRPLRGRALPGRLGLFDVRV